MTTLVKWNSVTSDNLIDFLYWAIDCARADTSLLDSAQTVRLHKLRLRLLTRNDHYTHTVRQRLYCGDRTKRRRQEISVAVLSPEDSSMPSPPVWGEPIFHPRKFEKLLEGTPFQATYFHDCNLWQIYHHGQHFGLQWMTGARNFPDWEQDAPLRVFLHWAFRFQNMRLTHAGTIGKNAEGAILVGKGGSGKSGTVIGGIAHGLESVGDDYVLVDQSTHAVNAYPLYPSLKQDCQGLERLGLEAEITRTRRANWQNKFVFRSEDISGQSLVSRMRIRAIIIPKISHTLRSSLQPIPKNRAMLALAPTGLFQLPGDRDSGVRFFSDLVRRVPCFELSLSRDPANVSKTLEEFIDGEFQCV